MRYLHTMIRVKDLDKTLKFFTDMLDMTETRRIDNEKGRFTLVFLAASEDVARGKAEQAPLVELTHNWDPEDYKGGRNFGHLAYEVDDIYATCQKLMDAGVTINRPPATATWPSCAPRTTSRSNSCRRTARSRRPSRGARCRIRVNGSAGRSSVPVRVALACDRDEPKVSAIVRRRSGP